MVVVALIFLSVSCQRNNETNETQNDSSFFSSAYGQSPDEQIQENTEDLYNSRQNAITRAVARVSPGVVGITVTQVQRFVRRNPFYNDPFWGQLFPELYRDRIFERKIESLGSGFLISRDGYIVTNQHVVDNAAEILVTMTDGRHFNAEVVGEDRLTDIALLKISGSGFPYLELGHSDDLLVGEWVIAVGNPFGLFQLNDQPTVTVGVISAIDRDWGRTEDGRLYLDMIQTDAAINHGNSGGPLVNSLGQVIGMNTFIFTGSQYQEGFIGIGFAIPIDKINEVVSEIRRKGSINREYWTGIYDLRALNPRIVAALKLKIKEGVIITQLDPEGPAFKAGLREYDVIVEVESEAVKTPRDFINVLNNLDLRVGSTVRIRAVRDEKDLTFNVKLESLAESMR
jgi:serine protease Do